MAANSRQLGQHNPQEIGSFRRLNIHQLFYREHISEIIAHGGYIIQAIRERNILQESVALANLFVIAMKIPEDGFQLYNRFTFKDSHHPEYPMSRSCLLYTSDAADDLTRVDL